MTRNEERLIARGRGGHEMRGTILRCGGFKQSERKNLAATRQRKLVILGRTETKRHILPDIIQTQADIIDDEDSAGATAFISNGLNRCGSAFNRPVTIDER